MRATRHAAAILLGAAMAFLSAMPAAWARTPQAAEDLNPEAASGTRTRQLARAAHFMMVSANPLATQAGDEMLRRGGSAVDAAIATQLVLNLVEPQSSGIGGGAFMVLYSAATGRIQTYDSRETAPAAARPDRFLDAGGKPLPFAQVVIGRRGERSVEHHHRLRLRHVEHRRDRGLTVQEGLHVLPLGRLVLPRARETRHVARHQRPHLGRGDRADDHEGEVGRVPEPVVVGCQQLLH